MVIYSVFLAYVSLFVLGLADNIRGPLFSEVLTDFNLTHTTGSWLFALSSTFALISSLAANKVLKSLTHKQLLQISLLILSAGLFCIASSQSLTQILFSACLMGLSFGFLGVCQNALVTLGTPVAQRKQWLSGLHAMYALASFLAPALVAIVARGHGTWRDTYRWASVFPLVLLFVSFVLPRSEQPQEIHKVPNKNQGSSASLILQITAAASVGFYVITEILISSRLGIFYRREMGASLEEASLQVGLFFLYLLLGRCFWTFVNLPWSIYRQMLFSLFFSILFLILGLCWWPYLLVLTGLSMAPFFGLSMTYLSEVFHSHINEALSVSVAVQSIFIVSMHLGVGILSDQLDIRKALWVGPIALILSLFFLWRVHETKKS